MGSFRRYCSWSKSEGLEAIYIMLASIIEIGKQETLIFINFSF